MKGDQRGLMNQSSELLRGREAAELLGVKRATLYAYASRGLVRSEPGTEGNARLYRRSDIERLMARSHARSGHGPVAASALRWGEPVLESALTAIRDGGLWYRGHSAAALAEAGAPFEVVAELLWTGRMHGDDNEGGDIAPPVFTSPGFGARPPDIAALLPKNAEALPSLALAAAVMGAHDSERFHAPPEAEHARARSIILCLAAALGLGVDPKRTAAALAAGSIARAVLIGLGARPTPAAVRAVNAALVLSADHELNASAFAVRVAASAGADLYACMSAGLAAISGTEHGGSCDRVEALVAEAGRPERAGDVVRERARRGEAIPGFGHRLYPKGDPRAPLLLTAAAELAPNRVAVRTLLAIVSAMKEAKREPPSIDAGLVALAAALGAPNGSAAGIFAVGRSAGWLAHAFEQREAGFMVRPRAHYTGR